jgi:nickel-dependent lactate racemase
MLDTVEIRYGKSELSVRLPKGCQPIVVRKPPMPLLGDAPEAILKALRTGVACPSLRDVAKDSTRVCIVICDITRPVPNGPILRGIVQELNAAGVANSQITVLIATGLHRPNLGKEMLEVVGDDWIFNNIRIENHFARDTPWMVDLGRTPSDGIPVVLNRHLVDADLRIVVGLVEPHFMAGYSGGRKVVAPGVAGEETIRTFHNYKFMANPLACNGNLVDNPLHRGQLEILELLGPTYAVNTIIDEQRQMSFVNFGDCVQSHLQSVEVVRKYAEVPFDRKFSTLITSAAGYPLDKTYYQTVKGMVAPLQILADGGHMIVASRCEGGVGGVCRLPRSFDGKESQLPLGLAAQADENAFRSLFPIGTRREGSRPGQDEPRDEGAEAKPEKPSVSADTPIRRGVHAGLHCAFSHVNER